MVKVRQDHPIAADGQVDIEAWIDRLNHLQAQTDATRAELRRAAELSLSLVDIHHDDDHSWGEDFSCFRIGLEMAEILADLQLDQDALVAAMLYRAVRENKVALPEIQKHFGDTVAKLVKGVLRMAAISYQRKEGEERVLGSQAVEQAEKIRKMLVAMVDDVRVALIKLAERTCAIRSVKNASPDRRRQVAREVADIYAPLAHRLGIGHIKWELEDLSFRYLQPEEYKRIAKLLDERRLARQEYIDNMLALLRNELHKAGIDGEVSGRAKHIYSIWRKMQRKGIPFSQVYDIRAVRILVPTVRDCYAVLGIVHSLWRNIPHEFDDYIASPKENGYRSLHTAVWGPENKVLEIQIRTREMHEESELGVCAHWRYKGTDTKNTRDSYEQKISWLRQVLEWHEELGGDVQHLQDDIGGLNEDRIYVFTPEGHVVDLPRSSTPLDFAYKIHTDIGHRCRGAKVNNRIVPLNYHLNNADQVEVITGKLGAPSRDWLNPASGYVNTPRARAKIQHWFKQQARDQNIAEGQALLDREFKRLALLDIDFEELAKKLRFNTLDDLYAAVGASDIGVGQVLNAAQKQLDEADPQQPLIPFKAKSPARKKDSDFYIEGVGNLLTSIANCCNPVPGDAITGYITLGKGVSIHRQDCNNILQLQADEPQRIIKVEWGNTPQSTYSVDIIIEAYDRYGLLKDITTLLDSERINISAMQTLSDKRKNTVDMLVTVEIRGFAELSRVLTKLNQLPNIASARRKHA
ncbi:GTP diphosphokinase [Cellvibrio japonicus]|uniref:GTP pyrophosphokinase n=1 Tax=Cellvibrio japonicus (strain Ueda107) TaxID=498211 RepID=B3PL61_CELJU|nr:GTP diphosphokinase [Cellvibrio japonicus]ACE84535.1 GTP pyrophosphokinase [Cellvibrio japonicus Ueda107]QEI12948.1 GTP diphosphokinase [Cellvibrio japonicus]QEI16522.1 GTP diphosphokinase [Cellvibrio japonicus]QEI20100.1 GTP diphosphokinase [Cellvibrio japonicus]